MHDNQRINLPEDVTKNVPWIIETPITSVNMAISNETRIPSGAFFVNNSFSMVI